MSEGIINSIIYGNVFLTEIEIKGIYIYIYIYIYIIYIYIYIYIQAFYFNIFYNILNNQQGIYMLYIHVNIGEYRF